MDRSRQKEGRLRRTEDDLGCAVVTRRDYSTVMFVVERC